MANTKTDVATKQDSALPQNRVQGNLATGDIRYIEAVYTCTGSEAASGDNIEVCDLPVGCNPIPELWRVSNEASIGGSVVAIPTLGDAGDADRYSATSISIHSSNAATQAVTASNIAASVIPRYAVTAANKRLLAAVTRTNAVTAGKKITFLIAFRLP